MRFLFPPKKKKSQIAVIITFIIALMLVFTVVFINITKISDMKTITAMAADRGALGAASALSIIGARMLRQANITDWTQNPPQKCSNIWWMVGGIALMVAGVGLVVLSFWTAGLTAVPALQLLTLGLGLAGGYMSWGRGGALLHQYSSGFPGRATAETSTYSALREKAVYDAALSVMTDTVMVKSLYDPLHPDPSQIGVYQDDSTGESFDLKDTTPSHGESLIWNDLVDEGKRVYKMPNGAPPPFILRFRAWYWSKRFNHVSEEELARFINEDFINYLMNQMYLPDGSWNTDWKYNTLSFPVDATIPSGSTAQWLTNRFPRQVVAYGPVDLNGGGDTGFLLSKFKDLCDRIVDKYGDDRLTFGSTGEDSEDWIYRPSKWRWTHLAKPNVAGITELTKDLQDFTVNLLQLANQPISQRMVGLAGWLGTWYDYTEHPGGAVLKPGGDGQYTHDLYQRLYHKCQLLGSWINVFFYLDSVDTRLPTYSLNQTTGVYEPVQSTTTHDGGLRARIASEIRSDGETTRCREGRGEPVDWCNKGINYCECWHMVCVATNKKGECTAWQKHCDGDQCTTPYAPITWQGIFGTCTGDGLSHADNPVCKDGDLYSIKPTWCSMLQYPAPCQTANCKGIPGACPNTETTITKGDSDPELFFQGQLSYDNIGGPTEVYQALEILRNLKTKLENFRDRIKLLADTAEEIIGRDTATKRQVVYCWNDVDPKTNKSNNVYHFINAQIDGYPPTLADFPTPVISKKGWSIFTETCVTIRGLIRGTITLSVSRYDTDLPTLWWNFRRRKNGIQDPHMLSWLESIRHDIMLNGKVTRTQGIIDEVQKSAITSAVDVTYGPLKTDITVKKKE